MRIYETQDIEKHIDGFAPDLKLWIYNGFDVLLPHEIHRKQQKLLTTEKALIYDFERTMQGPAMTMSLRGVLTDPNEMLRHMAHYEGVEKKLETIINRIAVTVWGQSLNINSPDQMQRFFYEIPSNVLKEDKKTGELKNNDGYRLKPIYGQTKSGSGRRITCDIKALEKIRRDNYYCRPVCNAILAAKQVSKHLQFLRRGIDSDRRFRCAFNVAGTKTGRWSSSTNPFGTGSNFQNLTDKLRTIFVPDEGRIFAYPDLEQAESRGVAYLSGDEQYILACESGDLHTTVARMVWPELAWTDNPRQNRAIADRNVYRHFSHRDLAKRGGHACNYMVSPWALARNLDLSRQVAEDFHETYFSAFPDVSSWHAETIAEIQTRGYLTSPIGRRRTLFGRRDDSETHKQAIATIPQGLISDILKIGIYRVWKEFDMPDLGVELLGDMHDGALMQIDLSQVEYLVPKLIDLMTIPVPIRGRTLIIPVDFTVGYRWTKDKESGSTMIKWQKYKDLQKPDSLSSLLDTVLV